MVSSDSLVECKIVAIKLYKHVLNVDEAEDLEVTFDGEEIGMADDFDDIIDTSDGAKYLVSIGSENIQVLVMVPNFSTHIIEIARAALGLESLGNIQYYIPAVIITTVVLLTTVWVAKEKDKNI
ncbi:MAG: hypothetical protein ACOC85_01555 [Thermoplasmatota archaeon]